MPAPGCLCCGRVSAVRACEQGATQLATLISTHVPWPQTSCGSLYGWPAALWRSLPGKGPDACRTLLVSLQPVAWLLHALQCSPVPA